MKKRLSKIGDLWIFKFISGSCIRWEGEKSIFLLPILKFELRGVAKKILYRLFQLVRRVGANGVFGGLIMIQESPLSLLLASLPNSIFTDIRLELDHNGSTLRIEIGKNPRGRLSHLLIFSTID